MIAPLAAEYMHRLATSALPDAPQLPPEPERHPGRIRLAAAVRLRRAADRLAMEHAVVAAR